jgi:hypothetical protein
VFEEEAEIVEEGAVILVLVEVCVGHLEEGFLKGG